MSCTISNTETHAVFPTQVQCLFTPKAQKGKVIVSSLFEDAGFLVFLIFPISGYQTEKVLSIESLSSNVLFGAKFVD